MKSVHVTAPGQIEVVDGPEPALEADQVMLRPITATLARDDVRRVYDGAAGGYPLPAGASAHEMVARVVEATYTARQWREFEAGELVAFYGTQAIRPGGDGGRPPLDRVLAAAGGRTPTCRRCPPRARSAR